MIRSDDIEACDEETDRAEMIWHRDQAQRASDDRDEKEIDEAGVVEVNGNRGREYEQPE